MSNNKSKNIEICVDTQTALKLSGVEIKDTLKDTLKTNIKRVNKNTNKYYTPTLIIYNYVRFVNDTQLKRVDNKKEYLRVAKNLIKELESNNFYIGSEWRDNNKLPYSKGNSKLSKDTVIINISPASLCIGANLNLCEMCEICYAKNSEMRYLNTLIYRLHQLIRFDKLSVDEIVNQFKNLRVFNYLRVNESGDLFNMDDLLKLREIAKKLYNLKGVHTYLYTHRSDLFNEFKKLQTHYFKINRSGVDYIPQKQIKSNHNSLFCDGNCNYCIYCKIELNTPIIALYHGEIVGDDLRDVQTKKRDLILKWECFKMFESGCDERDIISHIQKNLKEMRV